MVVVHWSPDTKDTIIKRNCLCEGCPCCKQRINKDNMYCHIFGEFRCKVCKDYRCKGCMYNNIVCNYCKRVI